MQEILLGYTEKRIWLGYTEKRNYKETDCDFIHTSLNYVAHKILTNKTETLQRKATKMVK